jgi:hypothetical protein
LTLPIPVIIPSAGVLRIRSSGPLRGEGQRAVLDETVGIAEIGDVLARAAQAERMALRDRLGAARVEGEGLAPTQLDQVLADLGRAGGVAAGRGRRKAAAGGGLVAGAVQAEQDLALDHHVPSANPHARDLAVAIGTHLVLHLHRFDDRQHRAGAHAPAGLDGDSDNAAGKGGADLHDRLGRADEGPAQRAAPG